MKPSQKIMVLWDVIFGHAIAYLHKTFKHENTIHWYYYLLPGGR